MKKIVVVIALLLIAAAATAQEPVTLVYKMNPGTTYQYALEAQTNITQEMGGREMITDLNQNGKLSIAPQTIAENGEATCWVSFSELSVKVKNPMMDTTLIVEEILGKRSEMVYTPSGKLLKTTVLDTLPPSGALMRMGMNPEVMLKRLLAKVSSTPVTVGSTWQETEPDSIHQGGIDVVVTPDVTYTVLALEEAVGHACYKIGFSGTNELAGKGSQMGAEIYLEGSGKTEGTMLFAPKEGLLISAASDSDQEQTIAISGAANMTIAQTVTSKSKLTYIP